MISNRLNVDFGPAKSLTAPLFTSRSVQGAFGFSKSSLYFVIAGIALLAIGLIALVYFCLVKKTLQKPLDPQSMNPLPLVPLRNLVLGLELKAEPPCGLDRQKPQNDLLGQLLGLSPAQQSSPSSQPQRTCVSQDAFTAKPSEKAADQEQQAIIEIVQEALRKLAEKAVKFRLIDLKDRQTLNSEFQNIAAPLEPFEERYKNPLFLITQMRALYFSSSGATFRNQIDIMLNPPYTYGFLKIGRSLLFQDNLKACLHHFSIKTKDLAASTANKEADLDLLIKQNDWDGFLKALFKNPPSVRSAHAHTR